MTFKRDSKGLDQYLNSSGVLSALRSFAGPMAESVRAAKPGVEVVVDEYTTTGGRLSARHAVSVGILDVRARTWQVRDGILTRAAAAQGLEVRD